MFATNKVTIAKVSIPTVQIDEFANKVSIAISTRTNRRRRTKFEDDAKRSILRPFSKILEDDKYFSRRRRRRRPLTTVTEATAPPQPRSRFLIGRFVTGRRSQTFVDRHAGNSSLGGDGGELLFPERGIRMNDSFRKERFSSAETFASTARTFVFAIFAKR